jgi:hypothetical protein
VTAPSTLQHGLRALAALAAVALAVLAATAGTALAAPACARQVVADWYDNGRVDRLYPPHCYRDAIKTLPEDVRAYSSAKDDIERALQFATRGKSDPGLGAPAPPPSPPPPPAPASPSASPSPAPATTASPPPPAPATTAVEPEPVATETTEAAPPVDTSGPSAVPMPLIVLGGLALLLLAAGSAGYLARRFGNRGGGEPPTAA